MRISAISNLIIDGNNNIIKGLVLEAGYEKDYYNCFSVYVNDSVIML
jgi:hypothetical protein